MKIILLQDISGVGRKGEVKNVSDGYGRNFLLPNKLGQIATPSTIASAEKMSKQAEQNKEVQKDILEKNIKGLKDLKVQLKAKANEKGHLFFHHSPRRNKQNFKRNSIIWIFLPNLLR